MEMPGFEPGAYRMRSERDTTTPHPRTDSQTILSSLIPQIMCLLTNKC